MGREFDCRSRGCEFDTCISTYTFMETDHEKFSTVILLLLIQEVVCYKQKYSERSGSVVECLTRDQGAAGSSLTGVPAL